MATYPQQDLPSGDTVVGVLRSKSPRSGSERRWPITGNDVLWLGRMLMVEDGPKSASETEEHAYERGRAMVSMILRRLGVVFFGGPYTSVEHILRGDPSGGNPKGWSSPLRYHTGPETSTSAQTRPWSSIPGYFQSAVLDTVRGRVPLSAAHVVDAAESAPCRRDPPTNLPGDYTCFTEVGLVRNAGNWRREYPGLTRSWIISYSNSRSWPEENIYIEGGARARTPVGTVMEQLALPLTAVGVLAGAWAFWQERRG